MHDQSTRIDPERGRTLLKEKLRRLMPEKGDYPAPFEGVTLYRRDSNDTGHRPIVYKPVVILIAQGQKSVRIGDEELVYGESSYFVAGVDMPTDCAIKNVSAERPYLSLSVDLDRSLIAQMAAGLPRKDAGHGHLPRGAMISALDADFIDAFLRLLELIEQPEQARVLAPLVLKEIHYRLLNGPLGQQLRFLNTFGTPSNQIAQSIVWLRENYNQPLSVDQLARQANMGTSTFHKHFKEVTALSPLQYQKRLRLEQAQRLMLSQGYDASQVSMAVGYESQQQFNREYKRLFGQPPHRHVVRILSGAAAE